MKSRSVAVGVVFLLLAGPIFAYVDSLWIVGGVGNPGELVSVEVWLQYEGGGSSDSLQGFDIPLTWDADICSVEAITVGADFSAWEFYERIDNGGTEGPPSVAKIAISAYTFGPPIGPPFVERGTHLAATIDFRVLHTGQAGDSAYVDTLMEAFSPTLYLGFMDKIGLFTYTPAYAGDYILVPFACGDCNGDSCITFLDMAYLSDYLSLGGPAPLGSGDVDEDGDTDSDDLLFLGEYLFDGGPSPCGITPPFCAPTSSPGNSVVIGDAVLCCSTTSVSLPLTVENVSPLIGMTFALQYDTGVVVCDSATFDPGLFGSWSAESRLDTDGGTVLMAVWTPSLVSLQQLSPGSHEVGTVWFTSLIPSDAGEGTSEIDTTFLLPGHVVSVVDGSQALLGPEVEAGRLDIWAHCGDVNSDCRVTVADALYLTTYIYRDGPPPVCAGDVNLDGRITVADATYLVTYIYRDGPPPCNPPPAQAR